MIQFLSEHIDWLSIKLTIGSIFLAFVSGSSIAVFLACMASISTIAYNIYRFKRDIKNDKK